MAERKYHGNKGLEYYRAYPRDFFEGVVGIDGPLRGFYRMVIDLIYMHDGLLLDDWGHIAGLTGYGKTQCRRMTEKLVEIGKLEEVSTENQRFFTQKRAKNELKVSRKYQEKQQKNAAKRWENNDLGDAVAEPSHIPPQDHKTTRQSPSDSSAAAEQAPLPLFGDKDRKPEPDLFEEFWRAYPHRGGVKRGKKEARAKWDLAIKKKIDPKIMVDGAVLFQQDRKAIEGFAPDPSRWISKELWDDEIEPMKGQDNGNGNINGQAFNGGGVARDEKAREIADRAVRITASIEAERGAGGHARSGFRED